MAYTCDYCKKTVYFAEKQFRKGLDYHGSCLQKKILEEKIKRVSLRGGLINKEMPTKEQLETVSNQAKDLTVKGIDQLKEDNKVKLQQMRKAKQLQNQKSNGEYTSNIPMKSVLDRESRKNIHQNENDHPENCPHDVFKSNQKYFPIKNGDNSTTTTTTTTTTTNGDAPKKKVIIRRVIKKVVKKSNGSTTPTTETPNGTNHTTENQKTEEIAPKTTTTTTTTNKVEEEDPLEKRMRERRELREKKRLEEEKKRQEELEQKQREYEELKEKILQQKREEALKNNEPEPVDDFDDEPIEDLEDDPIEDENYNQPITSDNLDEEEPIDDYELDGEILDEGEDFDDGGELAFCPECGVKQSDSTAKFCEDCGQPLDI